MLAFSRWVGIWGINPVAERVGFYTIKFKSCNISILKYVLSAFCSTLCSSMIALIRVRIPLGPPIEVTIAMSGQPSVPLSEALLLCHVDEVVRVDQQNA